MVTRPSPNGWARIGPCIVRYAPEGHRCYNGAPKVSLKGRRCVKSMCSRRVSFLFPGWAVHRRVAFGLAVVELHIHCLLDQGPAWAVHLPNIGMTEAWWRVVERQASSRRLWTSYA